MEIIAYKGRPFSVFVDEFVSHLHCYSCTAITLSCHFGNIEVESNDGSHLESLNVLGPRRQILKNVHSLVDFQTVTKYSAISPLPNLYKYFVEFMQ